MGFPARYHCPMTRRAAASLLALSLSVDGQKLEDKVTDKKISGEFHVKLTPQTPAAIEEPTLGRMAIDKQFEGPLSGHSKGMMTAFMTEVKGSAGYVAMERVTGKLDGREGTFVLQHSSTMERGTPKQSIFVVPDSGTAGLTGLSGSMIVRIEGGKHYYDFTYRLP